MKFITSSIAAIITPEYYSAKTIDLGELSLDRRLLKHSRASGPQNVEVDVIVAPDKVYTSRELKTNLGRNTPFLVWNERIRADTQITVGCIKELSQQNVYVRAALCGASSAMIGGAGASFAAALHVAGLCIGQSIELVAVEGALVGAALGGLISMHHFKRIDDHNKKLSKIANFIEDLKATFDDLPNHTVEVGVELLLDMARQADSIGGSSLLVMHECIRFLDTFPEHELQAMVAEFNSIRHAELSRKLVGFKKTDLEIYPLKN